jgi:hypothetical protein
VERGRRIESHRKTSLDQSECRTTLLSLFLNRGRPARVEMPANDNASSDAYIIDVQTVATYVILVWLPTTLNRDGMTPADDDVGF